jgi:uncharacterized protein YndB with AHSA1/START domain
MQEQIMTTAIVAPDQDAVVSEIEIAAPPDRVFHALLDPKQVMQWWTGPECEIEAFSMEPKRGGRWRYDSKQGTLNVNGITKFHCDGEVIEFDPPRVLAYSWIANWHDDNKARTLVRWDLEPRGQGTRVRVTHSGLANLPVARQDYSGGWPGVLDQLKNFMEHR